MQLLSCFWLFFFTSIFQCSGLEIQGEEILNVDVGSSKVKHSFQAEVTRLMDIIINSLYSQKEVFLREVISNSADALEKTRFLALSKGEASEEELAIDISFDKEKKLFSISDNGIGMTKSDLLTNLGTIAQSGTMNFLESLSQGSSDLNLIGQFGVGFYSVFLVADRVTVISKNDADSQHIWESTADGTFAIFEDPRGNTMSRGTKILLQMKEDSLSLLSEKELEKIIKNFSQFTAFPVYLNIEKEVEEEDDNGDKQKVMKVKPKLINDKKPLWLRPKEEITEEQYNEFYKVISKDYSKPLSYTHFHAEGEIEFKSILYIPKSGKKYFQSQGRNKENALKLYVRRVLVSVPTEDLLPVWLGWVQGVVDSDDLPLKVDREALSQSRILSIIQKRLTRKVLEMIKKMSKDDLLAREEVVPELLKDNEAVKKFSNFYNEYKQGLKYGCIEDDANREKIVSLFRFVSLFHPDETLTVEQYIHEMREGQKQIYYITGTSPEALHSNPNTQMFRKKGQDVLFLTDALDEPCLERLETFQQIGFSNVEKGDIQEDEDTETELKAQVIEEKFKPLMDWWKDASGNKIRKLRISKRLVEDPVSIATEAWGTTGFTEKILKAQGLADEEFQMTQDRMKILEINPTHPIIQSMLEQSQEDPAPEWLKSMANNLVDTALLASGYEVPDMRGLTGTVYRSILIEMGKDPRSQPQEIEVTDQEIEEARIRRDEAALTGKDDEDTPTFKMSDMGMGDFDISKWDEEYGDDRDEL